jgi:hypothetical protein
MPHCLRKTGLRAAVIVTLLAGGCSDKQAGLPSPGEDPTPTNAATGQVPTSTTTTASPSSSYGAPSVSKPLNASKFVTQPCAALDSSQLANLGLPTQGVADTTSAIARNAGPSCD